MLLLSLQNSRNEKLQFPERPDILPGQFIYNEKNIMIG